MRCPGCDVKYPSDLLEPVVGLSQGDDSLKYTLPVCALCGLEIVNKTVGFTRERFGYGTRAELLRVQALLHRKRSKQTPRTPCEIRPCTLDHEAMQKECYERKVAADCPDCGFRFKARVAQGVH